MGGATTSDCSVSQDISPGADRSAGGAQLAPGKQRRDYGSKDIHSPAQLSLRGIPFGSPLSSESCTLALFAFAIKLFTASIYLSGSVFSFFACVRPQTQGSRILYHLGARPWAGWRGKYYLCLSTCLSTCPLMDLHNFFLFLLSHKYWAFVSQLKATSAAANLKPWRTGLPGPEVADPLICIGNMAACPSASWLLFLRGRRTSSASDVDCSRPCCCFLFSPSCP